MSSIFFPILAPLLIGIHRYVALNYDTGTRRHLRRPVCHTWLTFGTFDRAQRSVTSMGELYLFFFTSPPSLFTSLFALIAVVPTLFLHPFPLMKSCSAFEIIHFEPIENGESSKLAVIKYTWTPDFPKLERTRIAGPVGWLRL